MNYIHFEETKNIQKATKIEELEKIEKANELIIGMSFYSHTEMFIYYKDYGKKKRKKIFCYV